MSQETNPKLSVPANFIRPSIGFLIGLMLVVASVGCTSESSSSVLKSDSKPDATSAIQSNFENGTAATYELTKEPDYVSDPYYCRIAVGPNREKTLLTAADIEDQLVYVDLNSNGDLTEDDEWFELVETSRYEQTIYFSATIPEVQQGEDIHTDLKIKYGHTNGVEGKADQVKAVFSMKLWGWDESTTDADLVTLELTNVKTELSKIPLLHFNGPLTMGNYRKVVEMPRGQEKKFHSLIGTVGEAGGTLTAIANSEITDDAHPQVEFEFPHQDESQPPIKVKIFLMTRC